MNKEDLINAIAERTGYTKKDCLLFIDVFCDVICEALRNGDRVKIVNFGVFDVKKAKPRTGKNFFDNTALPIPARKVPTFIPGEGLKRATGGEPDVCG